MSALKNTTFLVHDWIDSYGGAEKVLEALDDVVQADKILTLISDPNSFLAKKFEGRLVNSSLHKLPFAFKLHRALLAYYPQLIESLDTRGANTIISSSHCVAKGVIVRADQLHISYIHTPPRYLWDQTFDYQDWSGARGLKRWYMNRVFTKLRQWDVSSANRVDLFLANSKTVARRIWRTYRRPSIVVYPFVDLEKFKYVERRVEDYFVVVSRLVTQKRVDLAVRACSQMGIKLKVIGDGPELNRLRAMAGPTVEFLGALPEKELISVWRSARALIFAHEEDFGIVPIESQALGVPVIAYARGGATETVIHGQSGILFEDQSVEGLSNGLRDLEKIKFNLSQLPDFVQTFSRGYFEANIRSIVKDTLEAKLAEKYFNDEAFVKNWVFTDGKRK